MAFGAEADAGMGRRVEDGEGRKNVQKRSDGIRFWPKRTDGIT